MGVLSFVVLVMLIYLGLGGAMFVLADSLQSRRMQGIAWVVAGCALAVLLGMLVNGPVTVRIAVGFGIVAVWMWVWRLMLDRPGTSSWQDEKRRKETRRQVCVHLALATGALLFSVPFYWLISTSLKPDERISILPPDILPMQQTRARVAGHMRDVYIVTKSGKDIRVVKMPNASGDNIEVKIVSNGRLMSVPAGDMRPELAVHARWRNYSDALKFLPPEYDRGLRPLWNTVYITLLTIIGTVLSSSLVAFGFARLRWPGRDLFFVVMLATMMIPSAVTMLPVFLVFRWLGWIDTLRPLWVPAFLGSGFNIFLLRQFFLTIPNELEEAARLDGCSYFGIYWRIMLPLIKPALAALTIFAFMGSWNNFMGPLIYISSPEKMTLAYALQLFQGAHGGEPGMMMASATLVMLPVLIVFFLAQRYIIEGVTLTGIKG